jgi:SAM-dependent methyltransferase
MKGFDPSTFGELYAEDYDALHDPGTTNDAVKLLADLAGPVGRVGSGRLLELAIGTGRIALPLARRGLDIHGIDGSSEMVEKLRSKPGGDAIPVAIGDYASVEVEGHFDLIFLVFNTLFNLSTQGDQLRCFANVSRHLSEGGVFLVETFVPDLRQFEDDQYCRTRQLGFETAWLDLARHDPVDQRIEYQRVHVSKDGIRMNPLVMRYAWPAEIDLMARLAGLQLKDRWGDWNRSPFTASSEMHVSVYGKQ